MPFYRSRLILVLAAVVFLAVPAGAATVYVANDGVDGPTCGTKTAPCRSITAAVGLATTVAGDRVLVGPGRYGDLDGDGVLGEPGEETPAPGCGCMLAINKAVEVESSEGAAATLIDGRKVGFPTTVLLIMTGGHFGKPGRGFMVTRTLVPNGTGIAIDSIDISVRGNQIIATMPDFPAPADEFRGIGILTVAANETIAIEGNQVIGWFVGIQTEGVGNAVRKNAFAMNNTGVRSTQGAIIGNVAVGNFFGFDIRDGVTEVVGNSAYGNRLDGFVFDAGSDKNFEGTFTKNNMAGNGAVAAFNCGALGGETTLVADGNYWGSPLGPGPDPADLYCALDPALGTFATKPFKVTVSIKP